jgi:hypothetical protein
MTSFSTTILLGPFTVKLALLLATPSTVTEMLLAPIMALKPIFAVTTMDVDEDACPDAVNPGGRLIVGDARNPVPPIVI